MKVFAMMEQRVQGDEGGRWEDPRLWRGGLGLNTKNS